MNKKDLSAINSHCILVFAHCFIGFLGSTAPDNLTAVMQLGLKIQWNNEQTSKHSEIHEPKFRFNMNFFSVHRSQYFISNSDWLSRLVSSSSNAKVTHHLWPVKYFRLVFTRNGVGVKIVSRVKRVLMALWKSKIRVVSRVMSATDCWSRKNQNVSVFFWLRLWLWHCLRSSENQIVRVGSRGGRILPITIFVIGLALPLLLATSTTQFSLDNKRWSLKRNQKATESTLLRPRLCC